MKDKERKRLIKIYGNLYKRVSNIDWEKCFYCGQPQQCWDHSPPISLIEGINVKMYKSKGGEFRLYPACLQCNALLNAYSDTNIYARLEYLALKYKKRLNKLPYWSDNELQEMGKNMRAFILGKVSVYELLADKIDTIMENMASDDFIDFE